MLLENKNYLTMERNGNYQELVNLCHSETKITSICLQISYIKALAYLEKHTEVRREIEKLDTEKLDRIHSVKLLLAKAKIERSKRCWLAALDYSDQAIAKANITKDIELQADAKFARAISLVEIGRVFSGLEIFQEIRNNNHVGKYRRGLSALNEGWILWDLGRYKHFLNLRNLVDEKYRYRIDLVTAMIEGKKDIINLFLGAKNVFDTTSLELFNLAVLSVEASTIFSIPIIDGCWLIEFFNNLLKHSKDKFKKNLARMSLYLIGYVNSYNPDQIVDLQWRDKLKLTFLETLCFKRMNEIDIIDYWKDKISPIISNKNFQIPLIPDITNNFWSPQSKWDYALCNYFNLISINSRPKNKYILRGKELEFCVENQLSMKIKLDKTLVTLKLIRILVGQKGKKISKSYIHQQLTLSKYSSQLHDQRIYKLFKRLEIKLKNNEIPKFWIFPGDNSVVLNNDVEEINI